MQKLLHHQHQQQARASADRRRSSWHRATRWARTVFLSHL